MEAFAMPVAGLSPDEAINGHYGPSVQPANVQSAGGDDSAGVAAPTFPNASAVLLWWFILLGVAVALHVLFLRINE